MGGFAKIVIRCLLSTLAVTTALSAQVAGPLNPHRRAVELDAPHIVRLSVTATERSWEARDHYTGTERDEDRQLDSRGK